MHTRRVRRRPFEFSPAAAAACDHNNPKKNKNKKKAIQFENNAIDEVKEICERKRQLPWGVSSTKARKRRFSDESFFF
jgi:hypothetical protein